MSQLPIRNFLISCLLIVFASCSLSTTKGFMKQSPSIDIISNSYFSDLEKDYIYKARFNVFKHKFGGILIIKKIKKDHHRIVLTSEFGKKIFDFEIMDDIVKLNYSSDVLNKKFIINTLQYDFQILVKQKNKVVKEFSKDHESIYQTILNKKFNYYVFSIENQELIEIINTTKNKEKMRLNFNQVENGIAKSIEIEHQNIKMSIHLKYISN